MAVPPELRAVRVRAAADEKLLAYAGLAELAGPLLHLVDGLPPIQAAALAGALALGPPAGDALVVAAAFRSLLHLAAERAPLLVLVEDAHLLDRGTAAVLAYVARRCGDAPLGALVTQDADHSDRLELPDALRAVFPGGPGLALRVVDSDPGGALRRAEARGSIADQAAALEALAAQQHAPASHDARLAAGSAWLAAGDVDRAVAAAHAVLGADPQRAARAHLLLGRAASASGRSAEGLAQFEAAVVAAGPADARVAAEASVQLALARMFSGALDDAHDHLREAGARLDAADVPGGDPLRLVVTAAEASVDLASGRATDPEPVIALVDRLATDSARVDDVSLLATTVALPLVWLEHFDLASDLLRDTVASLRVRGAVGAMAMPLCALSLAERRAGRITRAFVNAAEAADLAAQRGDRTALLFAWSELACAHSVFGDVERCRRAAQLVLDSGTQGPFRASVLSALATVELFADQPERIIALLEPLVAEGGLAPAVTLFHPSLVAAYAAVGRRADAETLLRQLQAAAPASPGRVRGVVSRCEALLAPPEERDAAFARALDDTGDLVVQRGITRLLHARRLRTDGCVAAATRVLAELAEETDENLLGAARAARVELGRLGIAAVGDDPAWALLGPTELRVALAAAERTPVLTLADQLRLSPPEVERLRDGVLASVGVRDGSDIEAALRHAPLDRSEPLTPAPRVEVRVLGGLTVLVEGRRAPLPSGAAATTVALLALRRAVHVEELTDVLWPDSSAELARRRLRNVLARVKQAAGPILLRRGERVELAADVAVDHHLLEVHVRRALAMDPGSERRAALALLAEESRAPLLPEAAYEDWSSLARQRAEARHAEVLTALHEG